MPLVMKQAELIALVYTFREKSVRTNHQAIDQRELEEMRKRFDKMKQQKPGIDLINFSRSTRQI